MTFENKNHSVNGGPRGADPAIWKPSDLDPNSVRAPESGSLKSF